MEENQRLREEMEKHEIDCVAKVSEEKLVAAAIHLDTFFNESIKTSLKRMINQGEDRFWFVQFHSSTGMGIRNVLRDGGFGEKELDIENLDYVYVQIIERAVMGKKMEWWG